MSAAVESSQRAALWNECASNASDRFLSRIEFQPRGGSSTLPTMEFGVGKGVLVHRARMPPLRVINYGSAVPYPFYQVTHVDRDSVFEIEGHGTLALEADELVVTKPEFPGEWTIEQPYAVTTIQISARLFRQHIADPDVLVARHLELPVVLHDILVRIMDASVALVREPRFASAAHSAACSLLHMLALAPGVRVAEDRLEHYAIELRREQVKNFIRDNYRKPGLSTDDIAEFLGITPRYVQMALAPEGTTPSECVRTCRLEAARRLLSSAGFAGHSITEVAFECGFASSAHFSTEFRKRFGRSPRSYRQSATTSSPPHAY